MKPLVSLVVLTTSLTIAGLAQGDIYRWDTGEVIPGTEGITPGPGMQLDYKNLQYADFSGIDLSNSVLVANRLNYAWFVEANLTNAALQSILTNANLAGANLSSANLNGSTVTDAELTGAVVRGANFGDADLTAAQLYSTASYKSKDLQGLGLGHNDLTAWDFRGQNIRGADFSHSAFTKEQLYSTASYQSKDLQGIGLSGTDLTGWDFSGQNIRGASFEGTTSLGFVREQLYSTASYQSKDLQETNLTFNDLTGWDFSGQNLSGARFGNFDVGSNLTNANLMGANLTNANMFNALLTSADLAGSVVNGTEFGGRRPGRGLITKDQLYSTASYQQKDLHGIGLSRQDVSGWDFSGQNLTNAHLPLNLPDAILKGADTRGAFLSSRVDAPNLIGTDGSITGLSLAAGQPLWVRDYDGDPGEFRPLDPIPITVQDMLTIAPDAVLRLTFESDAWDSLISFEPGIPVQLGGTLELTFADDVDVATQVGRTLDIFDWTGVDPAGAFTVASQYLWDLTNLYSTGEIRLAGTGGVADYDGSGVVEQADLDLVLLNWGATATMAPIGWINDLPGGLIDQDELDRVLLNWGNQSGRLVAGGSVPEPRGMLLAVLGVLSLAATIRRSGRHSD